MSPHFCPAQRHLATPWTEPEVPRWRTDGRKRGARSVQVPLPLLHVKLCIPADRPLPICDRRTPLRHVSPSPSMADTSATVVDWRTPLGLEIQSAHRFRCLKTLKSPSSYRFVSESGAHLCITDFKGAHILVTDQSIMSILLAHTSPLLDDGACR